VTTNSHGHRIRVCAFPRELPENAFVAQLYGALEAEGFELLAWRWRPTLRRVDIFHVQWPDATVMGRSTPRAALKVLLLLVSTWVFRVRGAKVVQHVHNLGSHDGLHPGLEAWMWRRFLPRVDCFVHMSRSSVDAMAQAWPQVAARRHEVVFHPEYQQVGTLDVPQRDALRDEEGIPRSTTVLLAFGLIRPYKGIEDLIAAFKATTLPDARLVIMGKPFDETYRATLAVAAADDPRITTRFGYVPEDELVRWMAVADVVVMSHRRLTNSGVALRALAAGRLVLAPALGALPEIAEAVGGGWVQLFTPPLHAGHLEAVTAPTTPTPDLSQFRRDVVGKRIAALFADVAAG